MRPGRAPGPGWRPLPDGGRGQEARSAKKVAAKPAGPPAKELFGAVKYAGPLEARAIGFYAKGCLAGATALPIDGPAWQAMRLSRNRNWGHPNLVALVEKLAVEAREHDGWPGLLVGDLSQPRGGPMVSGHASHQVGLDADIWLTPMPDRRLTEQEREDLSATSMVADDKVSVDPKLWTDAHVRVLKRAASYASVERIFVHPAIKKAVCEAPPRTRPRLAAQDPRLLGPQRPLPRAYRLPRRQHQLRAPAAAAGRRRLRQGADQLAGAGQAEAQAGDSRPGGCQAGAAEARPHAGSAASRVPRRAGQRLEEQPCRCTRRCGRESRGTSQGAVR